MNVLFWRRPAVEEGGVVYLLVISLLICVSISKRMTSITHKETNLKSKTQDDESMIMTCENKTSEVYTNHSLIASPPYPSPTFSVNCHFSSPLFFSLLGTCVWLLCMLFGGVIWLYMFKNHCAYSHIVFVLLNYLNK